jgi:hypothetical protein
MPMPESKTSDVLLQIQSAWQEAQAQLAMLREQVEHTTELAQAKVQSNLLARALDKAYRDLGAAVWVEVTKGKMALPNSLVSVRKALEGVTQEIRTQNESIDALLAEGEEAAARSKQKAGSASKAVASSSKRR